MLIEIIDFKSNCLINRDNILNPPFPGSFYTFKNKSYFIFERLNSYSLYGRRYKLVSIKLYVKPMREPDDLSLWKSRLVIGNPKCKFNALNPLLRCTVWPNGDCNLCSEFRLR